MREEHRFKSGRRGWLPEGRPRSKAETENTRHRVLAGSGGSGWPFQSLGTSWSLPPTPFVKQWTHSHWELGQGTPNSRLEETSVTSKESRLRERCLTHRETRKAEPCVQSVLLCAIWKTISTQRGRPSTGGSLASAETAQLVSQQKPRIIPIRQSVPASERGLCLAQSLQCFRSGVGFGWVQVTVLHQWITSHTLSLLALAVQELTM